MNKYIIKETNVIDHKNDILTILKSNLTGQTEEIYAWKYEKNPLNKTYCWLAQEETTNTFVGSAALFSRQMFMRGEKMEAGLTGDFAVEKKHRAFGPALKMQKTIQSSLKNNNLKFIYTTPNELSEALFLKIGYKEIGRFKKYVKVIKAEYQTNKYLTPARTTKFFSLVINFLLKFLSRENWHKTVLNYKIEMPMSFDERFDLLFEKEFNRFLIIGARHSNFLNWRYINSPLHIYRIFTITGHDKGILGYITYYIEENMCHIDDMLCVNSDDFLNILLAKFFLFLRKLKVGSVCIYYLGDNYLEKKLKEFNFFVRTNENTKVLIYTDEQNLDEALLKPQNWYFFRGDNDV